jgi:hypothetical protein
VIKQDLFGGRKLFRGINRKDENITHRKKMITNSNLETITKGIANHNH